MRLEPSETATFQRSRSQPAVLSSSDPFNKTVFSSGSVERSSSTTGASTFASGSSRSETGGALLEFTQDLWKRQAGYSPSFRRNSTSSDVSAKYASRAIRSVPRWLYLSRQPYGSGKGMQAPPSLAHLGLGTLPRIGVTGPGPFRHMSAGTVISPHHPAETAWLCGSSHRVAD
jgi:hypothetical protein